MINIFEYTNYKEYLLALEKQHVHGFRTQMARAMSCQLSYLSQVLNKSAHISQEQALKLANHFELSHDGKEFLLLLVQHARAGSADLKKHYDVKIEQVLTKREKLSGRIGTNVTLPVDVQAEYYRHWSTSAIHVLLTIPSLTTQKALANYLNLSSEHIGKVLNFLVASGLAVERGGQFQVGHVNVHADKKSPFASRNNVNWRLRSIETMGMGRSENFYYSSVVTLSEKDVSEVRKVLISSIEKTRKIIVESGEDSGYALNVDFFHV